MDDNQKGPAEDEPANLQVQVCNDAEYLINFLRMYKVSPAFLRSYLVDFQCEKSELKILQRRFESKTRLILTLTKSLKLLKSNSSIPCQEELQVDQLENEKQVQKFSKLQQEFSKLQQEFDDVQSNPSTHNYLIRQERAFQEAAARRNASENPDLATLQLVYDQKIEERMTLEQELSATNQQLQALKAQFEAFQLPVPVENVSAADAVKTTDTNVNDET